MFHLRPGALLFLSVMSILSNQTYAAESNHRNLYVDGALGWSNMASAHVNPYHFKDKQIFGYRISMGYLFPINRSLSLGPEVGYGHYGKLSYTNAVGLISNYNLAGWDVLASFKYKPNTEFNLYFKAGAVDLNQRLVIVGPNATPGGFYQQVFKPMVVFAASYNLLKQIELSLSYTHIFASKAPLTSSQQFTFTDVNQPCSVDAVMFGISYFI